MNKNELTIGKTKNKEVKANIKKTILEDCFIELLFKKILKLPEKTLVYPAHDYNGKTHSTIENEKNNNPRLQVKSAEEYAEIMHNLKLSNPKMMDIAVPANKKGLTLKDISK